MNRPLQGPDGRRGSAAPGPEAAGDPRAEGMAPAGDSGLLYACLTHVPLPIAFPDFVVPIYLGAAQHPGALNLRDLAPEWEAHHPSLGSTAGSFALRRLLTERFPNATRVGICQYRKFVSRDRIHANPDPKYRVMDAVHKDLLQGDAFARQLWPGEREFLVTAPRRFTRLPWYRKGYLKEYARDHCVEDLLRFTGHAVELGVLSRSEVLPFFREDVLVAGGIELGVYPAAFWALHNEQIEKVVRACVEERPQVRDGYQARAWAFCAERLGSFLLLKHFRAEAAVGFGTRHIEWLNRRRWRRRHVGQLNLITFDTAHRGYQGGV